MKRGRPPQGAAHADRVSASSGTKARLKVILQTLSGEKNVERACAELGVNESHFYRLREKALAGAAAALEPRPVGRPRAEEVATVSEVAALRAELGELRLDLRASQIREELALTMPHVLLPRAGRLGEKKGRGPVR